MKPGRLEMRMRDQVSASWVEERLVEYSFNLPPGAFDRLACYLNLLQKWNARVNLTAIRELEESFRRNFLECLWLLKGVELKGRLLDVGSGAGFPGLVLKAAVPGLKVTLLEPVAKKRGFLAEVNRMCNLGELEIRSERLERFEVVGGGYDFVTARAVGNLPDLVAGAQRVLAGGGRICLWVSAAQAEGLRREMKGMRVESDLKLPTGDQTLIWVATFPTQHVSRETPA